MTSALICLGCRTVNKGQALLVQTLERAGELMTCKCGRRYPIVGGVPIVVPDLPTFMRTEGVAVIERDLAPEIAKLLAEAGPDDAPYAHLVEHLAMYLDSQWGDRADPATTGPGELAKRIAARASDPVDFAVELGCNAGRIVAELAAGANHVVGLDLQFSTLRRGRQLLEGETVSYLRRITGRHYEKAKLRAGKLAIPATRRTLVCGDALDPPLVPGVWDRVVALNVIDAVRNPEQLLLVMDGLCAPGGELILASPYAWQPSVMPDDARLGGADPAGYVANRLRTGSGLRRAYVIEEEAEIPWTLRRDSRSAFHYQVHYLRARAQA